MTGRRENKGYYCSIQKKPVIYGLKRTTGMLPDAAILETNLIAGECRKQFGFK